MFVQIVLNLKDIPLGDFFKRTRPAFCLRGIVRTLIRTALPRHPCRSPVQTLVRTPPGGEQAVGDPKFLHVNWDTRKFGKDMEWKRREGGIQKFGIRMKFNNDRTSEKLACAQILRKIMMSPRKNDLRKIRGHPKSPENRDIWKNNRDIRTIRKYPDFGKLVMPKK